MLNRKPLIQRTARGLTSLFLLTLLTACETAPQLQAVYISRPVTANLALLCNPTIPLPLKPMQNPELHAYALALHDQIKECATQQAEYRKDVERLVQKANQRK